MPELPEVETVCRGLSQMILGQKITRVTLHRTAIRTPIPKDFVKRVEGAHIKAIHRRAKYILMELDRKDSILFHLGMSGRMLVKEAMPNRPEKHDHAVFQLGDGRVMIFNDPRRFGVIDLVEKAKLEQHTLLRNLGLEPLSKEFTPSALTEIVHNKKAPIKSAIMDQRHLVGVGNIYASEALFMSHIRPTRQAKTLKPREIKALCDAIPKVLNAAIASGGSTLRDYVRSDGDMGYFQHRFQVYDKAGKPCPACKIAIRRIVQAGRSTFFCPSCQH